MEIRDQKISIIIPVYNAKQTIERCVDSILAQTLPASELILIDDGSTDGSAEILDRLATEHTQVVHIPNGGVSHARNLGMELATGDWISFVDADDTLEADFLEQCVKALEEDEQADIRAMAEEAQKDIFGRRVRTKMPESDEPPITQPPIIPHRIDLVDLYNPLAGQRISGTTWIEQALFHRDTHVWGKLYRARTLKDNGLKFREDFAIGEDMLFLLDLALLAEKNQRILCIPAGSYHYEDNANGAIQSAFKPSYLDQIRCWQEAETLIAPLQRVLSPYTYTDLAVTQIMAAFLVLGKLAAQPAETAGQTEARTLCKSAIRHALKRNGAFAALDNGYKIKTMIYRISPKLYLKLYGSWKKEKL